jgi:hypothetical protein
MKNIFYCLILLISPVAQAEIETHDLSEAWFFVWSSCPNCCESGEGIHLYISNVVKAKNRYDFENLGQPFYDEVNKQYPNGAPNGEYSNGFKTREAAQAERDDFIREWKYGTDGIQIHDISI